MTVVLADLGGTHLRLARAADPRKSHKYKIADYPAIDTVLKDFAPEDRPNATIVFWTFRVMVGLGVLMIALALWALVLRRRSRLYTQRGFLRFALLLSPAGLVAILAGWYTTEIGRQPWLVTGVLTTAQAAGPVMATGALEQSNVDAAGALVQMIQLQRQFEMQVKVIKHGDEDARSANTLLRLNG